MASSQSVSFLSWIRGFHVYQGWWTPKNGETLQLVPEPENPKDKNAVKNNWVVGHVPLRLANTTEGVGLLRHFLAKPGASGIVKVCGKAVNRGGGLGMEVPCEYIFTGPGKLLERLEKCLDLAENPAVRKEPVRSKNNAEVNRGRKRKTKDESNKDHGHLTRKKKSWIDPNQFGPNGQWNNANTVFTTFDHIVFLKRTLLQFYGTLLHAEYCIELVFATVVFSI